MTDQRVLPIKVLACRKPLPGKVGGGIFSFQEGTRTEFGSFFFDCLYCEQVKVDPETLKTKAQFMEFFNEQLNCGRGIWGVVVRKRDSVPRRQIPTEDGCLYICDYFSPYVCIGKQYYPIPSSSASQTKTGQTEVSSARGLSNPLFKVGSVNLLNQNQMPEKEATKLSADPPKLAQAYDEFMSNIATNTNRPQTGNLNPNGIEPLPIVFDQRPNDPFPRKADMGPTGPPGFDQRPLQSQVQQPMRTENFGNQTQQQQLGIGASPQRDLGLFRPSDDREFGRDVFGPTGMGSMKPPGTLNPLELNLRDSTSGKDTGSFRVPDSNSRMADMSVLPPRPGESDLELLRARSELSRITSGDQAGNASPSPTFSLPKTVEGLMEKTVSSFIRSDFSKSIITNAIELEICLSLARILNRDAKRFIEHHQNDPDVLDLAVKFNLQPDNHRDPKKELSLVRQLTTAALSASEADDEKVSVDSLDAIHPRMRPKSELDLRMTLQAQTDISMPPPTSTLPSNQRRWLETSRSAANLFTSSLGRPGQGPNRPIDESDRWRSEQNWLNSRDNDGEKMTSGFNLAPGAEREKALKRMQESRSDLLRGSSTSNSPVRLPDPVRSSELPQPSRSTGQSWNPTYDQASRSDLNVNPFFNANSESNFRPASKQFDPAPGAERSLQNSSSMRNLGSHQQASTPEPSRSSLWSLSSSNVLSGILKRRSHEPVDEASGGMYGKKNYF